jgi:hypothetical protein
MALLFENIPEENWKGLVAEILESKYAGPLADFGILAAGQAYSSQIPLDVSHKDRITIRLNFRP